ncbi:MAG: AAA family ATPase [Aggregatilineales bacterium]
MSDQLKLLAIALTGYRPFQNFQAEFGPLEIIVGANGSGKSALFEFLRFLRDAMTDEIPPEIIPGGIGQQVFHVPGPERFEWALQVSVDAEPPVDYRAALTGPLGRPTIANETITTRRREITYTILNQNEGKAQLVEPQSERQADLTRTFNVPRGNQLILSMVNDSEMATGYGLREFIRGWRFFSAFEIDKQQIRRGGLVEQEPTLRENAGNLTSVLNYLFTEYRDSFDQLQQFLRSTVPGFKRLSVKARGGPGEVRTFWQEASTDNELTLADLSDGTLRLLCWATLCYQPHLPTLICIDEPDLGLHPRTLPVVAGLLKKVSERTQVLVATHASFLLTQFDLHHIAVMRKENGAVQFIKPDTSKMLLGILEDFGAQEVEILHRSDELEQLA